MAEGTPLERVQVVNSGARVQIPPSPLVIGQRLPDSKCVLFTAHRTLTNKQ